MKLIIGLGNPGKEYQNTRHNVGFMCADILQKKLSLSDFKLQKKFGALVAEGTYGGEKIVIAKPQTFMNASGEAAQKLVHFYNCEPGDVWLMYDDVDLALRKIRLRENGTAGTHNGMKSVISSLGFTNFPRIRIGIESRGVSAPNAQEIASFVLHPFLKEEVPIIRKALEDASSALLLAMEKGIAAAMDVYN